MKKNNSNHKKRLSLKWWLGGSLLLLVLIAAGAWQIRSRAAAPRNPPEADKVLAVQAQMPFQILIPAYMPAKFDRSAVGITFNELGPGGEPMIQLAYADRRGGTLFVRQWVPINPEKEILAGSRPVETKWGQAWLLKQGENLVAIWADVGPLRVSIYSPFQNVVTAEEILQMTETLGPASNQQVFSFVVDLPELREVKPPPPFEVPLNDEGIQEFTLVVTPGGYDPLRFKVKQGIPVRMYFRAIGQVGCGKELIFPVNSSLIEEVKLETDKDTAVLEYTPDEAGVFSFNCSHQMYRGVMTVAP